MPEGVVDYPNMRGPGMPERVPKRFQSTITSVATELHVCAVDYPTRSHATSPGNTLQSP